VSAAAASGESAAAATLVRNRNEEFATVLSGQTVTGDASVVYQELRNRITVTEHVDNATWTYPQISKLTKDMVENRIIHIVWDDYGIPASDPAVDQIKQQLEQAVMGVIVAVAFAIANVIGALIQNRTGLPAEAALRQIETAHRDTIDKVAASAASMQWAVWCRTTPRKLRSVAPPGGGSVL